jgi:peptide/nickel transport system permease protein
LDAALTSVVPRQVGIARLPWRQIRQEKAAVGGALVVAVVIVLGVAGGRLAPYGPREQVGINLVGPSWHDLAGTDELGRDVFSRVIDGARVSMSVGFVSVVMAVVIGVPLGLVAAYFGGWVETIIMRLLDAVIAFPAILLALLVAAVLGQRLTNMMVAVGIVFTPTFARLIHSQVLSVREFEFVVAAKVLGVSDVGIMRRHILPNVMSPVIIQASLTLGWAIIIEASLSFLGLGVQPPTPSWGSMLRAGYGFFESQPWLAIAPGIAITVTVLALNLLGDGLRNWLDPRQRRA